MSGEELTVHVGHEGTDTIEAPVEEFESHGSFGTVLRNHAGPAHVHCRLDGDLAHVATLEETNYYVESESETFLAVLVDDLEDPVEGRLELSTGYGSSETTVDVTVTPRQSAVEVDETLSRPQAPEPEPTSFERVLEAAGAVGLEPAAIAVASLGVLAIGLGLATAAVVGGPVAIVGVLVVTIGVGIALFSLFQ